MVPVPQMGEQLPDVLQFFATLLPFVAEQDIEVPKIFLDTTPQRLGDHLRQPQMVEQWVHVPTVVSFLSLQQLTAEQIVDIPVPGWDGGGARGGLQGFAGQSSTASSSRVGAAADGAGQGVFRTFPQFKKSAKQGPHSGSELPPESSPSTLSAHQMPLDEQFVDVPVPQVSERSSRSLLHEVLRRRQEAEEAARWREQNALLEDEDEEEDEDDEEEEISRFPPHFRPRRWCRFLLAGSIELHPDSW